MSYTTDDLDTVQYRPWKAYILRWTRKNEEIAAALTLEMQARGFEVYERYIDWDVDPLGQLKGVPKTCKDPVVVIYLGPHGYVDNNLIALGTALFDLGEIISTYGQSNRDAIWIVGQGDMVPKDPQQPLFDWIFKTVGIKQKVKTDIGRAPHVFGEGLQPNTSQKWDMTFMVLRKYLKQLDRVEYKEAIASIHAHRGQEMLQPIQHYWHRCQQEWIGDAVEREANGRQHRQT